MSLLSTWTIPTDPGFQTRRSEGTETRESDLKRAKPRVKPEAMSFALKNQGTVAQLFNPYAKPPSIGSSRSGNDSFNCLLVCSVLWVVYCYCNF